MRKNGSRLISFNQYRATDLFLFAVILIAFELIIHFAFIAYNGDFIFSPMLPIAVLVMMRWGWWGVLYAEASGMLFCLLNLGSAGFNPAMFAVYGIGNLFIALLLLAFLYPGKKKIAGKWYLSALFVILAWAVVGLGRSATGACFGYDFTGMIVGQFYYDLVSLAVGIVAVLVLRRIDGMFEDQKQFLFRLDRERKEKMMRDEYGDAPLGEIDPEALSILSKRDKDIE